MILRELLRKYNIQVSISIITNIVNDIKLCWYLELTVHNILHTICIIYMLTVNDDGTY